ncbi:MAG: hypothetical protein A2887_05880 [Alphaproteobacteria bacterium RIFCSPLOWO2_01_FULL_40_26]|nr:MAG: hypothetical protein A3D15_02140 [Alphaproteobacteria bacterium RIFCSPHIGHO2_02_FULL_40_34]OFW94257.1 MAG: hypothetical protein A2887_05880 [Alphaproteobacteria bacterium RIFCSPLOWO2_01_FULL_40_26]OFX09826.1 MAG: hypothetical protein A3H30_00640 [Alphaproteobacteria bacterium RIFCSPLOWO2_02_FULL_40_19]OFX11409.1 MAG: hypothetical protein A3G22_01880 [Alphaproteobacteria bacterium RIFCSPLOWO2_12_FULL_40_11]
MKRAFSLIELSIVILIIGILVAGITQSSRLVSAMKLNTARSLTQSSPVAGMNGLTVWFDSISEKSFGSDLDNNDPITQWISINPQSPSAFTIIQGSGTEQPKYLTKGINGLPAADFDGLDCLQRASTKGDEIFSAREVSLYIVQRYGASGPGEVSNIGFFTDSSTRRFTMHLPDAGNIHADLHTGTCCSSRISAAAPTDFYSVPHIVSVVRQKDTSGGTNDVITLRVDRTTLASDSNNTTEMPVNLTTNFSVGCWATPGAGDSYLGQIGEVIIFDRYLKEEERDSIEKYLEQKWGI